MKYKITSVYRKAFYFIDKYFGLFGVPISMFFVGWIVGFVSGFPVGFETFREIMESLIENFDSFSSLLLK